jgi:hypothetical protein
MAHTPGPWEWRYSDGLYGPKVSPRGGPQPVVTIESDGACGDPECCGEPSYLIEVSADDAALIASAPDLLEAVKAAMQFLKPDIHRGPDSNGWVNTMTLIQDAIAKAGNR